MNPIIINHAAFVSATDNAAVESRSEKVNITDILTSAIYSNLIATVAIIVSLVAVPASGYLSYKYAIKGEKRKEWNQLALPIREKLIAQIDAISRGEYFYAEISRVDILRFGDLKSKNEREELLSAFESFETAHSFEELWKVSPGRKMVTGDTTLALAASRKLFNLIERK